MLIQHKYLPFIYCGGTSRSRIFFMSSPIPNSRFPDRAAALFTAGNGADALKRISMIGNNMELDPGIGTCGKQGQGVPVGVGQPSLRLDKITVGGTAA